MGRTGAREAQAGPAAQVATVWVEAVRQAPVGMAGLEATEGRPPQAAYRGTAATAATGVGVETALEMGAGQATVATEGQRASLGLLRAVQMGAMVAPGRTVRTECRGQAATAGTAVRVGTGEAFRTHRGTRVGGVLAVQGREGPEGAVQGQGARLGAPAGSIWRFPPALSYWIK